MNVRKLEELSEMFASDSIGVEHLERANNLEKRTKELMEKEGVFLQLKDEKEQMLHNVRTMVHFTEEMYAECKAHFIYAKTASLLAFMHKDIETNPIEVLSEAFAPIYSVILKGDYEYRPLDNNIMAMFLRCMNAANQVLAYFTNEARFEIEYAERAQKEMEKENGV